MQKIKRTFLLSAVLVISFYLSSYAQSSAYINVKSFPESAFVLTTGAMLTGALLIYPEADVVRVICANDSTYTLPARLVRGFAVKDPLFTQLPRHNTYFSTQRICRVFLLATSDQPHLLGWGFYEQLNQGPGPLLLLRREQALPSELVLPRTPTPGDGLSNTSPVPLTIPVYSDLFSQTTLYLRNATGTITRLRKPQHLLKYLPHQAPQLRAYIWENGLHYDNLRDLSFIVTYANTLL